MFGDILDINDRTTECGVGGTNSLTRSFEYDPLYRLTKASGRENNPGTSFPWWDDVYRSTDDSLTTAYTQHYKYDQLGNIQSLQHIGDNLFTRNFDYSSADNRLNSITVGSNTCSYSYDASGNQTQENSSRFFEWDFGNQMRCFYNQAGTAEPTIYAQYLYDGTGNRVKKIVRTQGGGYESISYIGVTFEYKTNGTDEQTTVYIMDGNSRIAMTRKGFDFGDTTPAVKYNLEDHLGSSAVLLETNGSLINREEYYPFGETSFGSYAKKRYRFSGKEKDSESGLYYYGARYYMPWACKFITCDPMAAKLPQWSSYVGFNDNPIRYIDPTGMKGDDWISINGQMFYDNKVTNQQTATERYGLNAIYRAPGYNYTSSSGNEIVLGENGFFTSNGQSKEAVDLGNQSLTDLEWNTSSSVGLKGSPNEWLSTVNLGFFGEGFTTTNPIERYFDPAWRTPEMIAAYKGTDNLAKLFAGTVITIVLLPLAIEYGTVTIAQLSGEYGVTTQFGAWYRVANTAADATSQAINISASGGDWNWGSTIGNLTFNNPFAAAAPGSLYTMSQDPNLSQNINSHLGNYGISVMGNYLSGKVSSVRIPLMSGGMKHGLSGFALPLMFNAATTDGIQFPTE